MRVAAAFDALVIGAGPAGSTAARLLAEAGWSVGLVEKAAFPRRKVCGEFISATSLDILEQAGLREPFAAEAGPPIRRVSLLSGANPVTAGMPPAANPGGPWGRALGRDRLDGLLCDAAVAAGARLFQPFKLVALDTESDLYLARIQAGEAAQTLSARRVICANGSWERGVLAPPPRPHRPSDLLAFKARFHGGALAEDVMPLLMFPGGYGGMVRAEAGRLGLSCCIRRDTLALCRQVNPALSAGEAVLRHIQRHCDGVQESLRGAELSDPILAAGPIRPGIRVRGPGRIFRVGNAAGEAHPIIAEGISMAMQSSWLLCRRLVGAGPGAIADGDAANIGKAYAADWRRQFEPRVRAAGALAMLAMRPGPSRWVATIVANAPQLLTWGGRVSGKTVALMGT